MGSVLLDLDVNLAPRVGEVPSEFVQQVFEIDFFQAEGHGICVQAREVEEGFGEAFQTLRLGLHVLEEGLANLLVILILEHLKVALEGEKGGFEFVGGVGDKLGLGTFDLALFGDVAEDGKSALL